MIKKFVNCYCLILLCLIFSNCQAEFIMARSIIDHDGMREAYLRNMDEKKKKFSVYLGKTSEEIYQEFGEPQFKRKDQVFKRKQYEEEWEYRWKKGIPILWPDLEFVEFYFNNNIVEDFKAQ